MKPPLSLIPLFPLLGAILNGFLLLVGRPLSKRYAGLLACLMPFLSFVISVLFTLELSSQPSASLHEVLYTWISSGTLHVQLAFTLDRLSALMILIITGVGLLIHLYSLGYMHEETERDHARYFTYVNLFLFAMLLLVLGDNLLVLFIGWEGVGLASYLLIGFYYKEADKAAAGMKAFVVNRIGDFGFLIGIFLIYLSFSTFTFSEIQQSLASRPSSFLQMPFFLGLSLVEWAAICFFIGAMGKSAQIPLYVWLPDAMAGPTPVSALIHAATMVTAGVYMVARLNLLYTVAPVASQLIVSVGVATAFFAATIGLFQNDIKKILAYSTVSQLGFMFIGVGVGAYSAGVFHLMTHAFFKALLFLGAGAVIYAMHHEQDIRKMGGLLRSHPMVGWTFVIGTLAIIGFPGFAGFFSKDEILWMALATQNPVAWVFGSLAAVFTSFYMLRMLALTFLGESRISASEGGHSSPPPASGATETQHAPLHSSLSPHAHASASVQDVPWVMTLPLVILALLSVVGGWVGIPHLLGGRFGIHNYIHEWLRPVFAKSWAIHPFASVLSGADHYPAALLTEKTAMLFAIVGMLLGSLLALAFYASRGPAMIAAEERLQNPHRLGVGPILFRLVSHKYYIDELYEAWIIRPLLRLSKYGLWAFDKLFVDGLVNLLGFLTKILAQSLSWLQSGNVKIYLMSMVFGLVGLFLWLMIAGLPY